MAALTPFTLDDARKLAKAYNDLDPGRIEAVEPVLAGTVNSSYAIQLADRRVFVRIYEEQEHDGAVTEASRLERLAARGVRTPPPLRRGDGDFVGTMHGKPVVVFPWRAGEMRCLASVTTEDSWRVGVALAELHLAGRDLPAAVGRFEPKDLSLRLDRLASVPFPAIRGEVPSLRAKLATWMARRDPTLPRGLVHGDVFRDNVLWNQRGVGAEISALLDFESASFGVLAYDLMVTVLAWSFRDALDETVAASLVAGYDSVRPLEARERAALLAEGCLAAIRFTITRLTDAELRAAEAGVPPRRDKDWRRFAMRLATLESLGDEGLARVLAVRRTAS